MEINYFELSGGINQATTKAEMGLNPKTVFWADSKNIEIHANKGFRKQKGNIKMFSLPNAESILGMAELETEDLFKLVIVTKTGKIYIYTELDGSLICLPKVLSGKVIRFAPFLRGMIIATDSDEMFYLKNNENHDIDLCNLVGANNQPVYPDCITVYKGRVWCSSGSTIYYSAIGSYNDFSTPDDAGYINDFHTDTSDVTAIHTYKDYLAIYKKDKVYLLSGSNPSDFYIELFADKGSVAQNSVINVDNKQFFLSNGIYALEQVGELNQIRLGSEISRNIRDEFAKFDVEKLKEVKAINYSNKTQIWFLFPYSTEENYHTIWIYDYFNHAWYKRVVPHILTDITMFHSNVVSADNFGNVYREDYGSSFSGENISFMWKSPFLSLGSVLKRKSIEDFYFLCDGSYDNRFNFSIYKDYDSETKEDSELIYSLQYNHLVWADEDSPDESMYYWGEEGSNVPVWAVGSNTMEKAEILDSNFSVQLCIEGDSAADNCAIIGLQFKEVYTED